MFKNIFAQMEEIGPAVEKFFAEHDAMGKLLRDMLDDVRGDLADIKADVAAIKAKLGV